MGKKKNAVLTYNPGDLVFAKVKGYSYWPARIEETPNDKLPRGKYKVFFYGTHETTTLKPDLILPFEPNREKLGKPKKLRSFNDGMWEIEHEPGIVSSHENVVNHEENSNSNSANQSDNDTENENETESNVSSVEPSLQRRKSSDSSASSSVNKKIEAKKLNSSTSSSKRRRAAPSRVMDDDDEESVKEKSKKQKVDEEEPLKSSDSTVSLSASNLHTLSSAAMVVSSSEYRKKALEESKSRWLKLTPEERDDEKSKLKRKKLEEKKREKLKSIRIQLALLKMDREIKKSLQLDNTDEKRCCLIMEDLLKLPFSQKHLFKAPEIVETIKKCRKYKNSEEVRKNSLECFYKFQYMFDIPVGETFWSVFEKEREKYLAENVEELRKERNFANKLQLEVGAAATSKPKAIKTVENLRSRSISTSNALACNIESPLSSTASSSINNSPGSNLNS